MVKYIFSIRILIISKLYKVFLDEKNIYIYIYILIDRYKQRKFENNTKNLKYFS